MQRKNRKKKIRELEGEMNQRFKVHLTSNVTTENVCGAKLKWESQPVWFPASHKRSLCLFCLCVSQDEAAAGCCCCSGCGQLCQPLSGRPGVPCLETQVWWGWFLLLWSIVKSNRSCFLSGYCMCVLNLKCAIHMFILIYTQHTSKALQVKGFVICNV